MAKIKLNNEVRLSILRNLANNKDFIIKGYSSLEIIARCNNLSTYRGTLDIDADNIDLNITQDELDKLIKECVNNVPNYSLGVNRKREFSNVFSASISKVPR